MSDKARAAVLRSFEPDREPEDYNRMSQAVEWADALLVRVYNRKWFSWNANSHVEFLERLARLAYEAEPVPSNDHPAQGED